MHDGPQGLERVTHTLNHNGAVGFRNSPREFWKISTYDGDITAGYIKQYSNLTVVTMRNAGHFAPRDRPGSSLNLLDHVLSGTNIWKCPEKSQCSMVEKKCKSMQKCFGNGQCDETTGGRCRCTNNFKGPDCSILPEILLSKKEIKMSPRDTKLFNLSHYDSDILLEIESDDHNVAISLLDKNLHHQVYNQKEHFITYRLMNHKLVLFIEQDKFEQYLVVITNQEFLHEITLKMYINSYNFQKKSFWAPGGFGFFMGIFSLALGIAFFVASFYLYRRMRQEQSTKMLSSIDEGAYKILPKDNI